MNHTRRFAGALAVTVFVAPILGCASNSTIEAAATTTPAQGAAPPAGAGEDASPASPDFDRLRPDDTEGVLAALEANPGDPAALASAAQAFSTADAAGMALLWSLMYGASGGDSASAGDTARAIATVFQTRITMQVQEDGNTAVSIRLAPGAPTAVVQEDGRAVIPVAHALETELVPILGAVIGEKGDAPWSLVPITATLAAHVQYPTSGPTALEDEVEVYGWLKRLEAAGHLEAFLVDLAGPAFPDEYSAYTEENRKSLDDARAYVRDNPFRPTRAVLPDDFVTLAQ